MRLLTRARDLARRKARERDGLFVAEGVRAVEELLATEIVLEGILCAPQLLEAPRGVALRSAIDRSGVTVSDVSEREFGSAASTESPQGVLAIGRQPVRTLSSLAGRATLRIVVLDGLQDPGNVGTVVRTAAALGVDASVALPGTVDLWNAKVVRSAMGALFRSLALHATWDEVGAFLERESVELWGTDASGEPLGKSRPPAKLALAVGNEGNGISASVRQRVVRLVGLEMHGGIESLNVAVATGIVLYELAL